MEAGAAGGAAGKGAAAAGPSPRVGFQWPGGPASPEPGAAQRDRKQRAARELSPSGRRDSAHLSPAGRAARAGARLRSGDRAVREARVSGRARGRGRRPGPTLPASKRQGHGRARGGRGSRRGAGCVLSRCRARGFVRCPLARGPTTQGKRPEDTFPRTPSLSGSWNKNDAVSLTALMRCRGT